MEVNIEVIFIAFSLNVYSEEDIVEDCVRMRVTCGKLTLSLPPSESPQVSENPADPRVVEMLEATGGHGRFLRSTKQKLKDLKETVKEEGHEDFYNTEKYQKRLNVFIQIAFIAILAYLILKQIHWFIQYCNLQDDFAEKIDVSDVLEGFVQLSRLSNIPLRQ